MHELTHWLQKGTMEELHLPEGYIQYDGSNYLEYISQKKEIEAHAVQSYYFIREMDSNKLETIKNASTNTEDLQKRLIDEFMVLTGKPKVFL